MSEETESQDLRDKIFKVITSENDLIELLKEQNGTFKFLSVTFKVDIDLYGVLAANPVEGITLLDKKNKESKPDFLKEISPVFDCSYIQFHTPVTFWDCKFHVPVNFNNTIFHQGFNFKASKFEKGLSLMNIKSGGHSTFGFKSGAAVSIVNSHFSVIENQYSETTIDGSLHFYNVHIDSGLNLSRCKVSDQLNLIGVKLSGHLDLSQSELSVFNLGAFNENSPRTEIQNLNIAGTEFSGQIQISDLNVNGTINGQGAIFKESIFFTNLSFNKHVYLTHTIFEKPIFMERVSALGNFSFYGATFNSEIRFNEIDLSTAHVSFTGCKINADLWLGSLLHKDAKNFSGTMIFQGATISPTSIVRIFNLNAAKSPAGDIDFSNALVRGLLDIRNVYLSKITFDGTVVTGNIQDNNSLHKAIIDRNTARLLKHEARRINNTISALSYTKIETQLYGKELSIRKFADWSILKLNWLSNNHGSDWLWAAGFTITCGLICYSLFTVAVSGFGFFWMTDWNFIYNDVSFWSGFINYFWLPTGFNELTKADTVKGGLLGGLSFVIGKILIAYGIYQTISAFRKFI